MRKVHGQQVASNLVDLALWLGFIPMIILSATGILFLVGSHAANTFDIDCSTKADPASCEAMLQNDWLPYQIAPYGLLGFAVLFMLKVGGLLDILITHKSCTQCGRKWAFTIIGKNNEKYCDCKTCGIYPITKNTSSTTTTQTEQT